MKLSSSILPQESQDYAGNALCSRQKTQRLGAALRIDARRLSGAGFSVAFSGSCPGWDMMLRRGLVPSPGHLPKGKGGGGEGLQQASPPSIAPWTGVWAVPWLPTSCLGTLEWKN